MRGDLVRDQGLTGHHAATRAIPDATRVATSASGRRLAPFWRHFSLRDDALAPVLLFVALAAFAAVTPAQNDTFWHLQSGREMWETRSFLRADQFSHTAAGTPVQNHWWLTQLTFFAAYSLGGPGLVTALAGALAFIAVYASWRLTVGSAEVRIVLLTFLALATAGEWSVRPQVVSLAFIVLSAHLIQRGRMIWLPALCVLWGNAHAMVVFGILMAGACAIEALIWSRQHVIRDGLISVGCLLAPMISPIGLNYWPHSLMTVSVSKALNLHEYRVPLTPADFPFWLGLAALIGLTAYRWRDLRAHPRADRILLVAAAFLGIAAITAARNVAFFAVVAAPVLSRLWPTAQPSKARSRPVGGVGLALVVLAVVLSALFVAAKWRNHGTSLGWMPLSMATVQAVRGCPDPTFNHLEDGGYLIWAVPERRVFVDSRVDVYPLSLLLRSRAADLDGEYRDLFAAYGIRCAVVRSGSRLDRNLQADSSMRAIHRDTSHVVFTRSVWP